MLLLSGLDRRKKSKIKKEKNEDDSAVSKRLREDVAIDHNNSYMILCVWEDNIDKVAEQQFYSFNVLRIRDYLSTKRLITGTSLKIEKCDKIEKVGNINWTVIDMIDFEKLESNRKAKHSPSLICPEIMVAELCIFPSCPVCKKHIIISPGETKVSRNNCNKRLLAKKLSARFTSTITVKIDNDNVTLKLFPKI